MEYAIRFILSFVVTIAGALVGWAVMRPMLKRQDDLLDELDALIEEREDVLYGHDFAWVDRHEHVPTCDDDCVVEYRFSKLDRDSLYTVDQFDLEVDQFKLECLGIMDAVRWAYIPKRGGFDG